MPARKRQPRIIYSYSYGDAQVNSNTRATAASMTVKNFKRGDAAMKNLKPNPILRNRAQVTVLTFTGSGSAAALQKSYRGDVTRFGNRVVAGDGSYSIRGKGMYANQYFSSEKPITLTKGRPRNRVAAPRAQSQADRSAAAKKASMKRRRYKGRFA